MSNKVSDSKKLYNAWLISRVSGGSHELPKLEVQGVWLIIGKTKSLAARPHMLFLCRINVCSRVHFDVDVISQTARARVSLVFTSAVATSFKSQLTHNRMLLLVSKEMENVAFAYRFFPSVGDGT